jgi:hypothetical protein
MTDLVSRFTEFIDAPVHAIFEYCRDPRQIYAGDPNRTVTEVSVSPEGVGTTARVLERVGFFVTWDIALEYVEVSQDERLVFDARPRLTVRGLGRPLLSPAVHSWTWTFDPEDGGTRLNLLVVERDPAWWDGSATLLEARAFSREVRSRLAGSRRR